jgi:hypothetical protein
MSESQGHVSGMRAFVHSLRAIPHGYRSLARVDAPIPKRVIAWPG